MNRLLSLGLILTTLGVSAQQTIYESNLLTRATLTSANVDVPEALVDGDDMTVATISGDLTLVYTFDHPVSVTGVNLVASDNINTAPSRVNVYARNADTEEWNAIIRIMSISYPLPYTNNLRRGTKGTEYTQYKVEITKVKDGGTTASLSELQLIGIDNAIVMYPEALGNVVTLNKDNYDNGVIGDNAWSASMQYDFVEPVAISGYILGVGAAANKDKRPAVWELLASDDGEEWVTLDMQANMPDFDGENCAFEYTFGKSGQKIDFDGALTKIYNMIDRKFYRDYWGGKYLVHSWNANESAVNTSYDYWWMAHAVDAYVDAYRRTGDSGYENRARSIRNGMYVAYDADCRDLWNSFFDDMEWMCLACIRASEVFKSHPAGWLTEAKHLFDWIWNDGWDTSVGGIRWNYGSPTGTVDSKNSCSNAPAMIAAALLYQKTGEQHYLDKAKMIYEFMVKHNLFEDGFVKDSPSQDSRGWAFTYNQGTWVGGLLELYRVTSDRVYYDTAVDLIDKSIDSRWYSPKGIMCESGKGDGGLFKGIYIRYITDWVLSGFLDRERQIRYANYLVENARSLYLAALVKPDMTIMANWQDRGESNLADYDASVVLSGLFLLEGVDRLRRAGILNDDYSVKNPNHGEAFKHYRLKVTENQGGTGVEVASFGLLGTEPGYAGVDDVAIDDSVLQDENWYTITGLRIDRPTAPSVYIHNRRKVAIR